ncbi:MAG: putative antitoxin of bacterial toxin-antitoxin system, YdaS/YdaT [Bradyrhizobium sp.]|nr:putative antitoxin of bacterial toxin-antitoxin system, YdaS/YdaT [Bradyrhizobium sp.]
MAFRHASQSELIERAILNVPGRRQEDLAAAMGVAQQTVSKLLRGEVPVSPEQAIAIHRATRGAVPGSALRPDLWCRPEHVPVQEPAAAPSEARSEDDPGDPPARVAS